MWKSEKYVIGYKNVKITRKDWAWTVTGVRIVWMCTEPNLASRQFSIFGFLSFSSVSQPASIHLLHVPPLITPQNPSLFSYTDFSAIFQVSEKNRRGKLWKKFFLPNYLRFLRSHFKWLAELEKQKSKTISLKEDIFRLILVAVVPYI